MTIYICKFCKSERSNANSWRNHERLCSNNPERQKTSFMDKDFQGLYKENQFTKAKKLGLPKPEVSNETKLKLSNSCKLKNLNETVETRQKRKDTINKRVNEGKWHTSLAKKMHFNYNEINLHGSWEVNFARWLDKSSILWDRCKERFSYNYENKERKYTPDFYLIEYDIYVEIKGHKTSKDEAKWNQFPKDKKLIVYQKEDLKRLKII